MNNTNEMIYDGIEFEYIKLEESVEFFCYRCGKRKIARKYAQFMKNGESKKICNACYGNLLSKRNSTHAGNN